MKMSSNKICGISKRSLRRLVQKEHAKPKRLKLNLNHLKFDNSSVSSNEYLENENLVANDESRLNIQYDNDELHYSDDDQCEVLEINNPIEINFNKKLANWAKTNYINQKALSELLKILNELGLDIPSDARSILKTRTCDKVGNDDVRDRNFTESSTSVKNIHNKLSTLFKQNEGLIERVKNLEKEQTKSKIIIEKLEKYIFEIQIEPAAPDDMRFFNFPLDTDIAMENLDELLKDEHINNKFKTCVRSMMGSSTPPQNLPTVISKIFTDKALLEFNLNGAKYKKSFTGLNKVFNGIYDAIRNSDFDLSAFEECMRIIFKQSHRRRHSVHFRQRQRSELSVKKE